MKERRLHILRHIIEQYIAHGKPVSSGSFSEIQEFSVSSATIRNEMAQLEKEGFIMQPHTSAGRVPTAEGYKTFVDQLMMEITEAEKEHMWQEFEEAKQSFYLQKAREQVRDGINILSKLTDNIAFATIPDHKETLYIGIARLLQQPEFLQAPEQASSVIEVLENGFNEVLERLDLQKNQVQIYISDDHLFPHFDSCSVLCTPYELLGFHGVIGIIGPIRMNYPKNKVLIELAKRFIEGQKLLS